MAMFNARKIAGIVPPRGQFAMRRALNYVRHRGLGHNDVFLASYPRSGNTWLKFMLAELITGHDVDFKSCEYVIPHVGFHHRAVRLPNGSRVIKTHEKFRKEYQRAIYIVRDGRDVAVSYYYLWLRENRGDFQSFLKDFVVGKVDFVGPWHDNVASWLDAKDRSQVLIIKYEDCLAEPREAMRRLSEFIGLKLSSDRLEESIRRNSTEKMRGKEIAGALPNVRKGVAGDWRNHFTDDDLELFLRRAGDMLAHLGYQIR